MSTATAVKTAATTKKSSTTAKSAHVIDKRAFVLNEERAVPVVTTVSMSYEARDALWAYKEEMGYSSMGEALIALLSEQGYEF